MTCSKSNIEYLTHSWNFYTGCRHGMDVCPCSDKCWARGMAHRYNRSFESTLHPEKLLDPLRLKKPARIGVCFTGDLFGEWVDPNQAVFQYCDPPVKVGKRIIRGFDGTLKSGVFDAIKLCPQHTFIFLTKNPAGLAKWGKFPTNCYVGVTACNDAMLTKAVVGLDYIEAPVKFLSIEPLMSWGMSAADLKWTLETYKINWLIIGGWSAGKTQPQIGWVEEIVKAADKAGIPVFLKNNLKGLDISLQVHAIRQQYPQGVS